MLCRHFDIRLLIFGRVLIEYTLIFQIIAMEIGFEFDPIYFNEQLREINEEESVIRSKQSLHSNFRDLKVYDHISRD